MASHAAVTPLERNARQRSSRLTRQEAMPLIAIAVLFALAIIEIAAYRQLTDGTHTSLLPDGASALVQMTSGQAPMFHHWL
jgi:hypothetical protein